MASSKKMVIYAALAGNTAIAITKFAAAAITGSSAMLAEGIHSLVDTGNQALLLYGLKRAKRPPDSDFPFGHGKEIYFWSFIVAIMIFAVGAGLSFYEGIIHLINPKPVESAYINYIVLSLAMLFEGAAWFFAMREFSKTKGRRSFISAVKHGKDPTVFVVLFEDSAAMAGLVVAFVGIFLGQVTGSPYFDGAASVIIGLILAATAWWLAVETKGLLIGERADERVVEGIKALAAKRTAIEHVNEVLTMHMGPDYILVNLSVDFADELPASQLEAVVSDLDKEIKQEFPRVKRIFVEAESYRSRPPEVC